MGTRYGLKFPLAKSRKIDNDSTTTKARDKKLAQI
jgi:hypothetical protein